MIKKRHITLLEIMIVILLIGIITSVVGYNVRGSLEKGKIFKTQQAQNQIKEILLLEVAKGAKIEDVVKDPKKYLMDSGLPKDVSSLLKDGWNVPFEIKVINKSDIEVISRRLRSLDKNYNNGSVNSNEESEY